MAQWNGFQTGGDLVLRRDGISEEGSLNNMHTSQMRDVHLTVQPGMSIDLLRQTVAEVQRDEAEAISLLINLLAKVRETSHTAPLENICRVVKDWQNCPPGVIVSELMKIDAQFEGACPRRDKK
jgi:hypothetical protein